MRTDVGRKKEFTVGELETESESFSCSTKRTDTSLVTTVEVADPAEITTGAEIAVIDDGRETMDIPMSQDIWLPRFLAPPHRHPHANYPKDIRTRARARARVFQNFG